MPLWVDFALHHLHHCPSPLEVSHVVTILFLYELKIEGFLLLKHISALGVAEIKVQG